MTTQSRAAQARTDRRARGLRVASVLALVAVIPLLGVAAVTISRVRDAQALRRTASSTAGRARDAVELARLDAALVDEMNFRQMDVVAAGIGVPTALVAEMMGVDPATLLPDAQARVDRHRAAVHTAGVDDAVDAARRAAVDLTTTQAAYSQVTALVEARLALVLRELAGDASTTADRRVEMADAVHTLQAAIDVRSAVALQMQSYFGTLFDAGEAPGDQVAKLVLLREQFEAGNRILRTAAATNPRLSEVLDAIDRDEKLDAFVAAMDDRIARSLAEGVPDKGAPISLEVVMQDIDGFAGVFGASAVTSTGNLALLDAAGAEVVDLAIALEREADDRIVRAYTLAALMALASLLSAAVATRFIVRPLRALARSADGLRNNDAAPAAASLLGPAEVRAASLALRDAAEHFDLVTRQARALAAGDLEAPVLNESASGGLGAALRDSVGTLRSALTKQDEFRRRLAHEAAHDGLTQLPNRNASMAQLVRSLARTTRSGSRVAVLFIDLDRFKDVNDHQGHQAGDTVLSTVAQRLVTHVREGDHVGRLGGDEFIVIAEPVDGIDDAVTLAERILDALREPIDVPTARVTIGASIGIAISGTESLTADELLRDADLAVYRAKEDRRGSIEVCNEDLRQQLAEAADLTIALRQAIANDELVLHYQPIIEPPTNRLHALEALVRWNRPGHERLQSPDSFIGFAERSNLIVDVDRWVIDAVAAQIARWTASGEYDGTPVAINVSGRHLAHDHFVQHVLQPLERHGVDPRCVIIEVTESALLDDLARAAAKLQFLRDQGVLVAIDDFGTGYTSLAHLRSLPIDILKIDRSFTVNAARNEHESSIVKLIIDTGHLLGATITAEGVETAVEADTLTHLGSDSLQGFYYARPQPSDAIVFGDLAASAYHREE